MCRRSHSWFALFIPASVAVLTAGCDYSSSAPSQAPGGFVNEPNRPAPRGSSSRPSGSSGFTKEPVVDAERKAAILKAVISLIQTAALKPGGDNFGQAVEKLNDYFQGTKGSAYQLSPAAREFLLKQETMGRKWSEDNLQPLESQRWTNPDTRHIEDCMLYYGIANREAGHGDDLTRVRRIFDWIVKHVQLVPAGSLGDQELTQAYARPHDVLLRGMATEESGDGDPHGWSERGWVFVSLCRQLDLDAALLTFTPKGGKAPIAWICAVIIDKKLYLFDQRIGMAIPSPDGKGVATLQDALSDPRVLGRLALPGISKYGCTRDDLLASPSKIGILLDSSPGYLSPRMLLLQKELVGKELVGKDRAFLFRDPAEQTQKFAEAIGEHFGGARLWELPIMVETLLFTNPAFVKATLRSLTMFQPELPLLLARVKQLRGETSEAIEAYVKIRFAENLRIHIADPQLAKKAREAKKDIVPAHIQDALDAYSTYFLGLAHLEQNNAKQAEFFFNETLKLLPKYGPRQPFYTMFRWGAQSNLGRLREARGERLSATACYTEFAPTAQYHGDLIRARDLIWENPMAPLPDSLPVPSLMEQLGK